MGGWVGEGAVTEPLALYIHWPFCLAKCPYCDFNSHVRDSIPQARFAAALRRELASKPAGSAAVRSPASFLVAERQASWTPQRSPR